MRMNKSGILNPVEKEKLEIRFRDLPEAWYETADFVLYNEQSIFSNDIHSPKRGFTIPYSSVDINTKEDWKLAERVFDQRND